MRKKLWYGDLAGAFTDADRNEHASQLLSPTWSWRFRILKSQALLFQGKSKDTLALLESELPAGLPADVKARKDIVQADTFCRLRESRKAEPILEEAEQLIAKQQRSLSAELSLTHGRCASNASIAREYFAASVNLAHGKDEFVEAAGLLNGGFSLLGERRFDEAIDLFLEGLKTTSSPLLRDRMLGNLGFAYSELGDWKRAISFSEQAVNLAERSSFREAEERWLLDLGKEHYALWDLAQAETYYLKALALARQGTDSGQTVLCLHNLAQLALRKNDPDSAEQFWKEGQHLVSDDVYLAVDRAQIAAARKQWPVAEELFQDLTHNDKADVVLQSMARRELGNIYWQEGKLSQADRALRNSIEIAEKAAAQIKREEYRMSFLDQERFYDTYIRFLVARGRPLDALMLAERSRSQVWTQTFPGTARGQTVALSATQALLEREKQIVLAYWVTDDESFLWAITSSTFRVFKLPGHRHLHKLIDEYNQEIQNHREPEESPSAQNLYDTLIGPARQVIPPGYHVIIVPSKVLCWVSFDALVATGSSHHYWIEDNDVQIAAAVTRLPSAGLARSTNHDPGRELLILGNPVEVSHDFPALKNASEEMRRVESHFSADRESIISGQNATPQAYSRVDPGSYRLIHLDTHGTASDLSPLDSAIILSPDANKAYKLYAREIENVPLHADLVTISACYGAGTRWYNNEGVVGLGWAFLRAGAHKVVAALWEVDDASSPQLMDDFYGKLTSGKSAAEALRDAKLKMLHSNTYYRHPYYWASLQLYTGS